MEPDFRQTGISGRPPGRSPFGTLLALITGTALLVLGFMFSLLILAAVAVVGLLGYGYLWWKTRALRRQINERMQRQMQHPQSDGAGTEGIIVEGEVIQEEHKLPR